MKQENLDNLKEEFLIPAMNIANKSGVLFQEGYILEDYLKLPIEKLCLFCSAFTGLKNNSRYHNDKMRIGIALFGMMCDYSLYKDDMVNLEFAQNYLRKGLEFVVERYESLCEPSNYEVDAPCLLPAKNL